VLPGHVIIFQEYRNILQTGLSDAAFKSEVHCQFKFVMLSLKQKNFASATDWVDEGLSILKSLQSTLSTGRYRGPTQRLICNIVSTADQLWEGGATTGINLAIQKCLTTVIKRSLNGGLETEDDQGAATGQADTWGVEKNFKQLVQAARRNLAPIPLPSVVWTHGNSMICLDGIVVQIPRLDPSALKLLSCLEFDSHGKPYRDWHFKM
jgi:hypothetical protein